MAKRKRTNNDLTAQSQNIEKDFTLVKKISIYQIEYKDNKYYHIFRCNMFVLACLIIARSQCWNINRDEFEHIHIRPQISVFAPEFNFRYLRSDLKDYMSKYKEIWGINICIKSYFNQINTFHTKYTYWNKV